MVSYSYTHHVVNNDFIQVPLGVLLKNENVTGDMLDILKFLHKYVPTFEQTKILLSMSLKPLKQLIITRFFWVAIN